MKKKESASLVNPGREGLCCNRPSQNDDDAIDGKDGYDWLNIVRVVISSFHNLKSQYAVSEN